MNRRQGIALSFLLLLCSFASFSQTSVTVSGRILADDLSPLVSASIYVSQFSIGTLSDSSGRFQISLKPGWNELSFSYIGYNAELIGLYLTRDTFIEVKLKTNLQLNEVTIVDRKQMLNALH